MAMIAQLQDGVTIKQIPLETPSLKIGRHSGSDVVISDRVVSLEHAAIEIVEATEQSGESKYYVKDLGSTNGTYVNDKKISRRRLSNGDLIRIGWTSFKFIDQIDQAEDKTLKIHKSWIPGVYYTKE